MSRRGTLLYNDKVLNLENYSQNFAVNSKYIKFIFNDFLLFDEKLIFKVIIKLSKKGKKNGCMILALKKITSEIIIILIMNGMNDERQRTFLILFSILFLR